jgi:hypothetical protein
VLHSILQLSSQIVTYATSAIHINATQATILQSSPSTPNNYNNNDISEYTGLLHITRIVLPCVTRQGIIQINLNLIGGSDDNNGRTAYSRRCGTNSQNKYLYCQGDAQKQRNQGSLQDWQAVENQGRRLEKLYRRHEEIKKAGLCQSINSVARVSSSSCPDLDDTPHRRYLYYHSTLYRNRKQRLATASRMKQMGSVGEHVSMNNIQTSRHTSMEVAA